MSCGCSDSGQAAPRQFPVIVRRIAPSMLPGLRRPERPELARTCPAALWHHRTCRRAATSPRRSHDLGRRRDLAWKTCSP